MGLTEKQGGSDLRAVSTRAVPLGAPGRGNAYELVGHKWAELLLRAALDSGWSAQRHPRAPSERQAGQPQQRQRGSGIRRRMGRHGGRIRAGPGRAAGNGRDDPAGLRAGQRRAAQAGTGAVPASRAASPGLRQTVDRAAADAQRAGRPGAGK
ncbi:hypothetical protein G6F22_019270 [Rhizopus arrhizus]|nr:hypothetical protein G6F22_019270 [Rhizopus arrhizus]